tara:strand:+ start:10372 stop:12084 length:1713 start_codon:yes stop_codon:yes gene_type:complete
MTAPLNYLKVIILFIASILIIACHSDGSNNVDIPDINTFNIYTHEQIIYSFDEVTKISTRRGKFNSGDNQFIELNTDETKQGYEYAAYVFDNSIYLINYDKESNAAITKLTEISSTRIICGLIPHTSSSEASFTDKTKSNRSTLDLPIITIEHQKTGESCDPELNFRDTLKFKTVLDSPVNVSGITKTSGKSENVFGGLVIDYSASASLLEDTTNKYNETGFLGQEIAGNKIVFNYLSKSENDTWEADFYPTSGVQAINQASNNHVVVQNDEEVYVLNAKNLFTINTASSSQPVQENINALFSVSSLTLDNASPITFNQRQNVNNFLIKHENTLFYFAPPDFYQIPSNETQASQNALKMAFDLTSDNTALVIQESNNIQTLIAISASSGQSTTILSAIKIAFYIKGNEFYVNTLELESNAGWQAHLFKRLNNNYTSTTYNNSRFIFADDLREMRNTIFLLSSDHTDSETQMIKPSLYLFDSGEANGRKKGLSSNKTSVDFSFGKLNTNVEDIRSSTIINDKYGKIVLKGINEDLEAGRSVEENYYFNPSQVETNPDLKNQSLSLMIRKIL